MRPYTYVHAYAYMQMCACALVYCNFHKGGEIRSTEGLKAPTLGQFVRVRAVHATIPLGSGSI